MQTHPRARALAETSTLARSGRHTTSEKDKGPERFVPRPGPQALLPSNLARPSRCAAAESDSRLAYGTLRVNDRLRSGTLLVPAVARRACARPARGARSRPC